MLSDLTTRPGWYLACLVGLALFAAAYGQAPLYYSNQNQYFLHGLAEAGDGLLRDDWLAQTADPTPVFSLLVAETARHLHPWAFHIYHALLQAFYAAALVALFAWLAGPDVAARRWPVFLALLVVLHSAAARWLSYRVFGQDYPWYFQAGVAGQYVLGAMLQPSVFGVLLVFAVALFARGHIYAAAVCLAAGATVHSTYLLPSALLTLGFLAVLLREGRVRHAVGVAAFTLLLVVPVTAYVLLSFRPTSPATFAEAQHILVHVRIPHHCLPGLWLDHVAGLQIAWVVLALILIRRTRLFLALAVPFALAALLTVVQVTTDDDTLALLFPWRLSAVLVPVATALILARLVALPSLPLGGRAARGTAAAAVVALAAGGVWICADRLAYQSGDEELGLMDFVRRTRAAGDVYFIPVNVPNLTTTRGSASSDFQSLADKRRNARVIPVDLQRFRLATGCPIYVDFKSIPYLDRDVIEWRDRLDQAQRLHQQIRQGDRPDTLAELRRLGVTHVVEPADRALARPGLEQVYADSSYQVLRVSAEIAAAGR